MLKLIYPGCAESGMNGPQLEEETMRAIVGWLPQKTRGNAFFFSLIQKPPTRDIPPLDRKPDPAITANIYVPQKST